MRSKIVLVALALTATIPAVGFVFRLDHSRELKLPGIVEIQEVRLSSRVGGRVARVLVEEGTMVSPGQPLVELDVPELAAQHGQLEAQLAAAEAALARAENGPRKEEMAAALASLKAAEARRQRIRSGSRPEEIEEARGNLASLEAMLKSAEQEARRHQTLISTRASSQSQVDEAIARVGRLKGEIASAQARLDLLLAGSRDEDIAEAEAEVARFQANLDLLRAGTRAEDIAEAKARVAELRARLRELETRQAECVIVAPEEALLEVIAARPGDILAPDQPVARVLRSDDLWIKAYVSEIDLGKLRLHQTVEATMDAYPAKRFKGTITHIATESEFTPRNVQSVDERRHQVFAIRVRLDDGQGCFKSGMAADIWVPVTPVSNSK